METFSDYSFSRLKKLCCFFLFLFVASLTVFTKNVILNFRHFDLTHLDVYLDQSEKTLCQEKKLEFVNKRPVGRFSVQPHSGLLMCRTAKHGSSSLASIFLKIYER